MSTWLRESGLAFFTSLTLHSVAMAFVVGINVALALRLLRFTPAFPLSRFSSFYRLQWIAVVVVFASGLALLLAYPAKALTNIVFYLKLCALLSALSITRYLQFTGLDSRSVAIEKLLASALLILWVVTLFAGRFLAYTHSTLLASRFY